MDKKYVQKVIPRVSTERYNRLKPAEARKVLLKTFNEYLQCKVVYNRHIGIPIQFVSGRKTIYGEALYRKKAPVIEILDILMEHAKYNNFGQRKESDPKNLIGYYNFKAYVYINDKKECVRLAVRAMSDGSFYYNVEVNTKKLKRVLASTRGLVTGAQHSFNASFNARHKDTKKNGNTNFPSLAPTPQTTSRRCGW